MQKRPLLSNHLRRLFLEAAISTFPARFGAVNCLQKPTVAMKGPHGCIR
jgi:hypothetical protein